MCRIMKIFKDMNLPQIKQTFDLNCSIETKVRLSQTDDFAKKINGIEGTLIEECF